MIFKLSVFSFQDLLDPTSFCVHIYVDNLLIDCAISVLFIVLKFDKFWFSKHTVSPLQIGQTYPTVDKPQKISGRKQQKKFKKNGLVEK